MAFDFLDSVKGLFTSDLISKAASSLGESEAGISKAMSGIIPSVLGSIISKANSDINGASTILDLAKGVAASGLLNNLGNMFGEGGSANLVSNGIDLSKWLLGNNVGRITDAISSFAGIREFSIPSLMAMTTPAALGILGQQAIEKDLTPSTLSNMLSTQLSPVVSALPVNLRFLAGAIGLSPEGGGVSSLTDHVKQPNNSVRPVAVYPVKQAEDSKRWSLSIVFAGLGVALVWLFIKGCRH